jgi:hypothetical protein
MSATILNLLQEAGEDFEWYPTTDEMVAVVARYIARNTPHSILDIGAGDGRVLTALRDVVDAGHVNLYAIEKAAVHIENMPAGIAIVGTDFEQQTLIDKRVDVIFCNPPYSQYEEWAVKILKESLAKEVYLVLPKRWADSQIIKAALAARQAKAKAVWSGDFARADRPARAQVDIVFVSFLRTGQYGRDEITDPFDLWFHEMFPEVETIDQCKGGDDKEWKKPRTSADLLAGYNLVDRLVELYLGELKSMHASYQALCSIDPGLLATIGVKSDEVKEGLRQKIEGLKNKYWQELFDHLDKITERLASKSREAIVKTMGSAVHVDFTADNAYAVVLWVLKNANEYIDSQVVDLFKELSEPECVKMYKSNQRTWDREQWRYLRNPSWNHGQQETPSRYRLEYRIVTQKYNGIWKNDGYSRSHYDYPNGLHKNCHDLLGDIVTVANNLGFSGKYIYWEWASGVAREFYLDSGEVLMRVKAFKNGNLHIQFHQGFIAALNVEASRLLGWIKSPKEAVEEMDIDFATAERHFQSNRVFAPSECKLLTAGEAA